MVQAIESHPLEQGSSVERLRSFIASAWQDFAPTASRYQWPIERDRWYELVFCVLYRFGQPDLDAAEARRLVTALAAIDLVSVGSMASAESSDAGVARPAPGVLADILVRAGFQSEQADRAVATLTEIATVLQNRYGGKIQRCLRYHGERMLEELSGELAFSKLSQDEAGSILTHWLQNVLNMPLSLVEPGVTRLCVDLGATTAELIAVADEFDLNLALLDDLILVAAPVGDPSATDTREQRR